MNTYVQSIQLFLTPSYPRNITELTSVNTSERLPYTLLLAQVTTLRKTCFQMLYTSRYKKSLIFCKDPCKHHNNLNNLVFPLPVNIHVDDTLFSLVNLELILSKMKALIHTTIERSLMPVCCAFTLSRVFPSSSEKLGAFLMSFSSVIIVILPSTCNKESLRWIHFVFT